MVNSIVGPIVVLVAALTASTNTYAQDLRPPMANLGRTDFTDQFIVKYKPTARSGRVLDTFDLNRMKFHSASRGFSTRLLRQTGSGGYVFKLDRFANSSDVAMLTTAISGQELDVEYAEPDGIALPAQAAPYDPYFSQQWALTDPATGLAALNAWTMSTGAGVVVAVIDSGHRPHADFGTYLINGYDFIADPSRTRDGNGRDADATDPGDWRTASQCPYPMDNARSSTWHGTHVAGIVTARASNGIGIAGVAPDARALSVRVLGTCGGYWSDVADAVMWAAGAPIGGVPANVNPARVVNLSLGAISACLSTLQASINTARGRGATVVVAAGNDGVDAGGSAPANCAGVVTVASISQSGARAGDSNYGPAVSLTAPGVGIVSTFNAGLTDPAGDAMASLSGTSMAAPHVSGTAALMLSVNPGLLPDDVSIILKGTSRAFPVPCTGCGAGIVNAGAAVAAVRPGAPRGTLVTSYGTRNSTTSFVVLANTGSGWITGLRASCSNSGSYITSPPPSALGPGRSMVIYASVGSSTYKCNFVVQGNNSTNSPYLEGNF